VKLRLSALWLCKWRASTAAGGCARPRNQAILSSELSAWVGIVLTGSLVSHGIPSRHQVGTFSPLPTIPSQLADGKAHGPTVRWDTALNDRNRKLEAGDIPKAASRPTENVDINGEARLGRSGSRDRGSSWRRQRPVYHRVRGRLWKHGRSNPGLPHRRQSAICMDCVGGRQRRQDHALHLQ
jgi:hypothetical protein